MIAFPNAKINLGLHVLEKRPDGFHHIETIFYPAPLHDILEIIPAANQPAEFTTSGLDVPGNQDENLVLKALKLLQPLKIKSDTSVRIHLHKAIPPGSGLGGGSADCAFTIKMLNDLWKLGMTIDQMQESARNLGSDCAFFIENKPVFASGRGDILEPLELDLSAFNIRVEVPPVHVSTREAYGMVIPGKPDHDLRKIISLPVEKWQGLLVNDFCAPVIKKRPIIGEYIEKMYADGAVYASMTGSGSAVYGIFSR
jgi:4-diphosphocytidyl-2-C-methyl-D-erythritol kinase